MIGVIFNQAGQIIEVRVDGNNLYFRNSSTGANFATMENLQLSKAGCIKEHPDLRGRDDWKEESIKRLKEKLKSYKTEDEKMKYIVKDLMKHGFEPLYYQKKGHRPIKLKK